MAGDRDDRIEDIGYLKKGVERLEKALDDKDRKDDEVRRERDRKEEQFRKSMYEMMPVVKSRAGVGIEGGPRSLVIPSSDPMWADCGPETWSIDA